MRNNKGFSDGEPLPKNINAGFFENACHTAPQQRDSSSPPMGAAVMDGFWAIPDKPPQDAIITASPTNYPTIPLSPSNPTIAISPCISIPPSPLPNLRVPFGV